MCPCKSDTHVRNYYKTTDSFQKLLLLFLLDDNFCYYALEILSMSLVNILSYYMGESVLLGTKPLVDSIRHFIQDQSGVFSVCHLCECRIVQ